MCVRASGLLRSRHLYRSLPFGPLPGGTVPAGGRRRRRFGLLLGSKPGKDFGPGPRGREPGGTRHLSDSVWAPWCRSPLPWEPRSPTSPTGTRNPHLQRVPAHGASCLNPVLALRKGARALNPCWRRQRWEPGSGWAGAWPPSGSATSGAPSPAALQTSPLARMRVPVPFLFLPGDAMSVRGLSGWLWGSDPPGGCKPGRGAECCPCPLPDLPWWLGSSLSPSRLKTDVLSCF